MGDVCRGQQHRLFCIQVTEHPTLAGLGLETARLPIPSDQDFDHWRARRRACTCGVLIQLVNRWPMPDDQADGSHLANQPERIPRSAEYRSQDLPALLRHQVANHRANFKLSGPPPHRSCDRQHGQDGLRLPGGCIFLDLLSSRIKQTWEHPARSSIQIVLCFSRARYATSPRCLSKPSTLGSLPRNAM